MILEDFIVLTKTGLYCRYGNFYLDPQMPVQEAVISHAHGDHAIGGNKNVYCTNATARFMQQRYKRFAAAEFYIAGYRIKFNIGGVEISFIPAGHILGSAQVLMEYLGIKYLYTGDYKLEKDITCEPIEFVHADVLITETTFANPATRHPDAEEEIKKLNTIKTNIMLGAYALGKSQRLIPLINQFCPEKKILLHHNIMPFAKIYEEFGIKLGDYAVYDRKTMKQNPEDQLYIVPPMVFNSYSRAINVTRVFVTGWQQNGLQLFISDHVDWDGILTTIKEVAPRQVWTLHGDGKNLKKYLGNSLEVRILN